ncbi:hypothetical protein HCH_05720 [Hahella chejuensis KCTC 2396]|uniref:Uncharacterized protein n=1 Tax=Hahella chejuensis (strain KCTC 2396) TaxID=349521 RepID=Q2SAE9_HAHCH|nr:hypothetical protein HCH_05720 [Hahella chejuensis KCTC 2396]
MIVIWGVLYPISRALFQSPFMLRFILLFTVRFPTRGFSFRLGDLIYRKDFFVKWRFSINKVALQCFLSTVGGLNGIRYPMPFTLR